MEKTDLDLVKLCLKDIESIPKLSDEEFKRYFKEYKNGNIESRNKIIESYMYLVLNVIDLNKWKEGHVKLADLIQLGCLTLLKALATFKANVGVKFETYARVALYYNMTRQKMYMDNEIRIPMHIVRLKERYLKNQEKLNDLSEEDTLEFLNVRRKNLRDILRVFNTGVVDEKPNDLAVDGGLEKIDNELNDFELLVTLKEILSPYEYYIIYTFLTESVFPAREIGNSVGIAPNQTLNKRMAILKRIKSYCMNGIIENKQRSLRIREKGNFWKLNVLPVTPKKIALWFYLRDELNGEDVEVLKNYCFSRYEINFRVEEEFKNILENVGFDEDDFEVFFRKFKNKYKAGMFELNTMDAIYFDDEYLIDRYGNLIGNDIWEFCDLIGYELTFEDKEVLGRFYLTYNCNLNKEELERRINEVVYQDFIIDECDEAIIKKFIIYYKGRMDQDLLSELKGYFNLREREFLNVRDYNRVIELLRKIDDCYKKYKNEQSLLLKK